MRPQIFPLRPNRVYRSYPGGLVLDEIEGQEQPHDAHFPEDWIASTTRAVNAGREMVNEGVSSLIVDGELWTFDQFILEQPSFFLGERYVAKFGARVAPLVKFLDSAVRLHFQCHPTIPFAQKHFHSNWGKTEAYHILQIRPETPDPHIYMGFQHLPTRDEMRRMVLAQDMSALERCFEPIPVEVGQTYFVPGGLPHAIGAGILMVEVMEPTDFVARFEWEKAGIHLAENAKFMGRDVEFGLDMLDFSRFSVEEVKRKFQPKEQKLDQNRKLLLGEPQTRAFRLEKWVFDGEMKASFDSFGIAIALGGHGTIQCEAKQWNFRRFDHFFIPFGAREVVWRGQDAQVLLVFPPDAD